MKTRYVYDTEFLEDGKTIELISIGIVCEDGREYYACNRYMPLERIRDHAWLMEHVVPSLPLLWGGDVPVPFAPDLQHPAMKSRAEIRDEVEKFLAGGEYEPELWAYYSSYDHVALAQLWGPMVDMPPDIPKRTNDIAQEIARLHAWGDMPRQEEGTEHDALEDARHGLLMLKRLDIENDVWLVDEATKLYGKHPEMFPPRGN